MGYYSWEVLYNGMLPVLRQRIEAHNAQFSSSPRNDVRLLKRTQINTLHNIVKVWCRQAADSVRQGRAVTNIVETNNPETQAGQGCADTAISHRRKLTFCGFLLGHKDPDIDKCKATENWRGTRADYQLLLDPALIPLGCLPSKAVFMAVDNFAGQAAETAIPAPCEAHKVEKSDLSSSKTEKLKINQLGEKESEPEAEAVRSYVAALFNEDASGSRQLQDDPAGQEDGKREEVVPPVAPREDDKRSGGAIVKYSELLVGMYVEKLGRGRAWRPQELVRGRLAAERLLLEWMHRVPMPEGSDLRMWQLIALMSARDRAVKVVDHMAEALLRNPKLYCLPPSIWFDPKSESGIKGAELRYLRPYELKAAEWQDQARIRAAAEAQDQQKQRQAAASQGDAGLLALMLKNKLMAIHPGDNRLRAGNLIKWSWHIRQAATADRHGFDRVAEAVRWLADSDHPQARFWRSQAGGQGIRSASGLRRALPHIFTAMDSNKYPENKPRR